MYVRGYLQGSENVRVVTIVGSRDLRSHSVVMLLLYYILYYYYVKGAGKSRACAEHTSGQAQMGGFCITSGCACAEHTSDHVTDITSGHVTTKECELIFMDKLLMLMFEWCKVVYFHG